MAYFEFPHTRNYDGDLGFVIKKIIELTEHYDMFFKYNSIKFADPLQWDITTQYEAYTIVFDYDSGYSYISRQPVPAGIGLSNPDFWTVVGPLIIDAQARTSIQTILSFIANIYETGTTATAVRSAGEYVVVNGGLYKTTATINIGETYTSGINMDPITIEDMIHELITSDMTPIISGINTSIGNINNSINTINHDIDNLEEPFTILIGDSYCEGYDPGGNNDGWGSYLLAKGIRGVESYIGGSAFYLGASDPKSPQTLLNNVTLPTGVTAADVARIVVCMGYNDFKQNSATIVNNIKSFITYAESIYPNATVYIGMCGYAWTQNADSILGQHIETCIHAYSDGCEETRAIFMPQVIGVLLGANGLSTTDYKHPNATGNKAIADALWAALHGVSYYSSYTYTFSGLSNSALGLTAELAMRISVTDGVMAFYGRYNNFVMSDSNAHSIHSMKITPAHFPCLPNLRMKIGSYFHNGYSGSSLAKSYYACDILLEAGFFDAYINTTFELINDAGDNFPTTKDLDINDGAYYSATVSF